MHDDCVGAVGGQFTAAAKIADDTVGPNFRATHFEIWWQVCFAALQRLDSHNGMDLQAARAEAEKRGYDGIPFEWIDDGHIPDTTESVA